MPDTFNDVAIAAWRVKPGWQRARRVFTGVRRYPVLPIAVLLIVMVIPSIFAAQMTTHNPEIGDLKLRLRPPAWIGVKSTVKTVTEDQNDGSHISLDRVQKLKVGTTAGRTSNPNPELLSLGDEVEIILRPEGSWSFPLGTDKQGRDILTRIIYGARISLVVSLVAIFLAGLLGSVLGITAAYHRGMVDHAISRLIDISMALPSILVALVLVVVSGGSFFVRGDAVVIVTVLILWSRYARQMRGETFAIMSRDFISRARVSGCSNSRIMITHIFPNVLNTLVVLATLQIGFVIILEASLSFLGAGIPRPTPAWGSMVADGRELITSAWWVAFFPGLAIVLTVLSMNLLGDWLRDRLDPKLRQI